MSEKNQNAALRVCLNRKDISDAELLADLRAVARRLKIKRLSSTVYDDHGKFSHATHRKRFGGWTRAVMLAKLQSGKSLTVAAEAVLRDIAGVARELKCTRLYFRQYKKRGRYSYKVVCNRFGNWGKAATAAGIAPGVLFAANKQVMLENLRDIWLTLGRQPTQVDVALPLSRFGTRAYQDRFGSFNKALAALDRFLHPGDKPIVSGKTGRRSKFRRKTSRQISWRMRFLILRRDHYRCCACGRSPATDAGVRLEVDHKIAWRKGGETVEGNLQTLCERCNGGKSDLAWEENLPG